MSEKLSADAVAAKGLVDWKIEGEMLRTRWRTGDFATGLRLLNLIGHAAEAADHHPDLDLRYPYLQVTLTSHDVGGLTERDVLLARQISDLADREGVLSAPDQVGT